MSIPTLDPVVARLTLAELLSGRRALALALLPAVLVAVAVVVRVVLGEGDPADGAGLVDVLGLATMLPVLCVVVGTSVVGPEIEDGSILYLLSKPVRRSSIVLTKLLVAVAATWVLGAVPVGVASLVLVGTTDGVALATTLVALVASVAYCALFVMLGVLTGNAVVVGLLYALIWETTVGTIVPGARALSVRQWAGSVGEAVLGRDAARLGLTSDVSLAVGVVLLVVLVSTTTTVAVRRLGALSLTSRE